MNMNYCSIKMLVINQFIEIADISEAKMRGKIPIQLQIAPLPMVILHSVS